MSNKSSQINWFKVTFWVTLILVISLWATGILNVIESTLNSKALTFKISSLKLTPYIIIKGVVVLIFLMWAASRLSTFLGKQISKGKRFDSSERALIYKFLSLGFYLVSIFIAFGVMGVDLTNLTIISGAVGVGLGFGLQKIVSNFISGIILLFERTISEGDLIEINGSQGFVKEIASRYTLLETADKKEIMIPNEDFITNKVINSTLSNKLGRIDIGIGISHDSDPHKAKEIMFDAVKRHPLCSKIKAPEVNLTGFSESSIDFQLFMWLDDVTEGRLNATNDILFKVWDEFKENNIRIPQRDVHMKLEESKKINAKV